MARCVISSVLGTNGAVFACVVHATEVPCGLDGHPANPNPLHSIDIDGRDKAIAYWQLVTREQRGLVIHRGPLLEAHDFGDGQTTCWCRPDVLPSSEVAR